MGGNSVQARWAKASRGARLLSAVIWGFLTEATVFCVEADGLAPSSMRWWRGGGLVRLRQSLQERAGWRSAGFEFPASGEVRGGTHLKGEPFEDLWGEERGGTAVSQKSGLADPPVRWIRLNLKTQHWQQQGCC